MAKGAQERDVDAFIAALERGTRDNAAGPSCVRASTASTAACTTAVSAVVWNCTMADAPFGATGEQRGAWIVR